MACDLIQVVVRVLRQHRQNLRLPGGGAQDHTAVGMQAPAPPGPVHEGRHALAAQLLHKAPQGFVRPPPRGLHLRRALQAHPPEDIRLRPANQHGLQP